MNQHTITATRQPVARQSEMLVRNPMLIARYLPHTERHLAQLIDWVAAKLRLREKFEFYGLEARTLIAAVQVATLKNATIGYSSGNSPYYVRFDKRPDLQLNGMTLAFAMPMNEQQRLSGPDDELFKLISDRLYASFGIHLAWQILTPWAPYIHVAEVHTGIWRVRPFPNDDGYTHDYVAPEADMTKVLADSYEQHHSAQSARHTAEYAAAMLAERYNVPVIWH